jgi:hypothetical protein
MTLVRTKIRVSEDGTISGRVSPAVPPGEHEVTIDVAPEAQRKPGRFDVKNLPTINLGPWPATVTLRREEIYEDDGR